jgi:Xaa-Pro aminopeptidase
VEPRAIVTIDGRTKKTTLYLQPKNERREQQASSSDPVALWRATKAYTIYLKLYQALMASIRPRATAQEIVKDAVVKMDAIMASFAFADSKINTAATAFVEDYRGRASTARTLGHWVGMEVHDVSAMLKNRSDLAFST